MGVFDDPTWQNLDPRVRSAYMGLAAGAAAAGHTIGFSSGWRSNQRQAELYKEKPHLAAPPGKSNHEFGLAMDLTFGSAAARRWVHENAHRYGMWFPMDYEPWHIQVVGIDRHNIGNPGAQVGGGRDAFSMPPDMRFVNPYDRMAEAMAQEDPFDPVEQFGRLVQMFSSGAGDMSDGMIASPDAGALLGSPTMPGPSAEAEELIGAVSGAADPTGAIAEEPHGH